MSDPHPFGPYELHELINQGGMAELWLGTDAEKRTVAVRKFIPGPGFNFTTKKRFLRGVEVMQKLQGHPFIIGYLAHGKIDGSLYVTMEYIEGNNLKILAAMGDEVMAENIANILLESGAALEHVHDTGFMHLDFKPENIVLSRNASLRLLDFDLSRPKPEKPEKSKDNPGTPAYMAPEQLLRQPMDHRVDIWAFGVMAFELLTSQKPFPGDSPDEILRRQLDRSEFLNPRELNGDIPAALEKIILKCVEQQPDDRYPHMSVLMRDLKTALYV